MKALYPEQHLPHYKLSIGKIFYPQGQVHVTPKWIVWPGRNSNSSEILWLPLLCGSMRNIRSKIRLLSIGQHFTIISIWELIFGIQGQVTPKSIVWSGRNSNSSENLWLSWLPARLMKIRSKLKALSIGQGQIWAFSALKGCNSEVNSLILPKFELIRKFMAVLDTCQFDEDLIKTECTIDRTMLNMGFFSTQGQVTLTWIVWCGWKSNSSEILWLSRLLARLTKIGSKVKSLSSGQHKPMRKKIHSSTASNTKENSPIWPDDQFIRDYIAVLVTCKFEEQPIKNEVAIDRTRSTMGFFGSLGQETPKWIVM